MAVREKVLRPLASVYFSTWGNDTPVLKAAFRAGVKFIFPKTRAFGSHLWAPPFARFRSETLQKGTDQKMGAGPSQAHFFPLSINVEKYTERSERLFHKCIPRWRSRDSIIVMAGLDPAIHVAPQALAIELPQGVDARNRSGHDE